MILKFPIETRDYWYKMVRVCNPLPEFKIQGNRYAIRQFVCNENSENRPGTSVWKYQNREACVVKFLEIVEDGEDCLRKQRDEARLLACRMAEDLSPFYSTSEDFARDRGWEYLFVKSGE